MATDDPSPFDRFRRTREFASLNGIRALAIVAVIFHHAWGDIPGFPLSERGFLGVDMFFVLSGFLIVTLLLREQEKSGRIDLPRFYLRRSLRIFPVYYGVILALVVFCGVLRPNHPATDIFFRQLPYYATYTSNWVVRPEFPLFGMLGLFWSLATEEQFYLVWPVVQKIFRRFLAVSVVIALCIGVNQLSNFRVIDPWFRSTFGVGWADLNILQTTFTPILLGTWLANALHRRRGFRVLQPLLLPRGASLAFAVAVAVVAVAAWPAEGLAGWPRLAVQCLMTLFLGACVAREDHALAPILRCVPLDYLGRISYGMYVYHMACLFVVNAELRRSGWAVPWLSFALTLALTVAVSAVSFHYYERYFLSWKDRFTRPR